MAVFLRNGVPVAFSAGEQAALGPAPPVTPAPRRTRRALAARRLFTRPELTAITVAAIEEIAEGTADIRIFLDDLAATPEVDWQDTAIMAGMQMLVDRGLITTARRAIIESL